MVELIDLSGHIEEGQPVYPGNQSTQYWVHKTHEKMGEYTKKVLNKDTESLRLRLKAKENGIEGENAMSRGLLLDEHGPTHVDALTHLDPTYDGSIDRMSLDYFYGSALGLDVSHVSEDKFITEKILSDALDSLTTEIEDISLITLYTGHRERYYSTTDPKKKHQYLHNQTGLDKSGAKWLAKAGIKNVGIDAPSVDHSNALETKDYPAHTICAKYEMTNMENMANLDKVAGKRYTLAAFPLKLRDGTGSPIRPVAIIPD